MKIHLKNIICFIIPVALLAITTQASAKPETVGCYKTKMTRGQVVNQNDGEDDHKHKGNARVVFKVHKKKGDFAKYRIAVKQFNDDSELEQIHLHCGTEGNDGDLLVDLPLDNIKESKNRKRIIVKGKFIDSDILQATCNDTTLDSLEDLAEAMAAGDVYTHTHPQDVTEIRGQIEEDCTLID